MDAPIDHSGSDSTLSFRRTDTNVPKVAGEEARSGGEESRVSETSPWRMTEELDETMEEIFHPSPSEQFSLRHMSRESEDAVDPTKHHFNERDYRMHRKESFPHHHQPLKRLHHHRKRHVRRFGSDPSNLADGMVESQSVPEVAAIDDSGGGGLSPGTGPPSGLVVDSVHVQQFPPNGVPRTEGSGRVQFFVGSETSLEPSDSERREVPKFLERPIKSSLKKPALKECDIEDAAENSPLLPATTPESRPPPCLRSVSASAPVVGSAGEDGTEGSVPNADTTKHKVTFDIAEEAPQESPAKSGTAPEANNVPKSPHHVQQEEDEAQKIKKHRHHKRRKIYDSLMRRQRSGADVTQVDNREVTEPEEAMALQSADLDDLASHRFDDPRGMRRHKIQAKSSVSSFIHMSRKEGKGTDAWPGVKKIFDHQPHEIFVELDELLLDEDSEELEWRETARWIKYEENVEEGADRWGKPHVASLSFHSLLCLRKCIEQGTVLLDLEEKDLVGVAYRVVDNMVITDQIKAKHRGAVMRVLLLRHRHVNDKAVGLPSLSGMRRNSSGLFKPGNRRSSSVSDGLLWKNRRTTSPDIREAKILVNEDDTKKEEEITDLESAYKFTASQEELQLRQEPSGIIRRIPEGAEATTVLVGALDFLDQPTIAFVRLAQGQLMSNLMEVPIPVRFIFILLGPIHTEWDYHEIGRSISTLMSNAQFHDVAYKAVDRKDLLRAINDFLDDSIVLPPGDWERKSLLPIQEIRKRNLEVKKRRKKEEEEKAAAVLPSKDEEDRPPPYDPLKRSGRLFGGLVNDIKNRYSWYWSDIRDGLNFQCLAAAIFIYFAVLSGAITFGGLLAEKTGNLVGVSETLVVTSLAGILFALTSGQPLLIIGTTGPVVLFDEILFDFCQENDIDFLAMRVWIGLWLALIGTTVVAFEGSAFVRFFTRFIQEIFAALISLLYIYEALRKLYVVFQEHPLMEVYDTNVTSVIGGWDESPRNQPNTALLSVILTFGTFIIANNLRHFRNSHFLGRSARRALGDFGVPIAIIIMVLVDFLIDDIYSQKLRVPEGISPSNEELRGWLINPMGVTRRIMVWHVFAASIAALLVFILLFLEIEICELILSKKERKMRKGSGFHLDLLVACLMETACALLGGPWMCAATVRSIAHAAALTVMSRTHAPGEAAHVIEVKEQRLTNLMVSLLIGLSVLMAPLLRLVPVAVLFGVFLYMGISAMTGIQLFERIYLLFMPVKHHPDVPYVTRVRTWKMHAYTLIQIVCLVVLWAVKSTDAAMVFPFVILLMVPFRMQLKWFFTEKELLALDGEVEEKDDKDDEPDFYEQIVA